MVVCGNMDKRDVFHVKFWCISDFTVQEQHQKRGGFISTLFPNEFENCEFMVFTFQMTQDLPINHEEVYRFSESLLLKAENKTRHFLKRKSELRGMLRKQNLDKSLGGNWTIRGISVISGDFRDFRGSLEKNRKA